MCWCTDCVTVLTNGFPKKREGEKKRDSFAAMDKSFKCRVKVKITRQSAAEKPSLLSGRTVFSLCGLFPVVFSHCYQRWWFIFRCLFWWWDWVLAAVRVLMVEPFGSFSKHVIKNLFIRLNKKKNTFSNRHQGRKHNDFAQNRFHSQQVHWLMAATVALLGISRVACMLTGIHIHKQNLRNQSQPW